MKNKKTFKLALFVLILAAILAFPGINSFASGMILGDMNDDGIVDTNDALHLLRHTLAPIKYPISQSGNIDGLDGVNSDDAIYLLRHVLNPDKYPIKSCVHDWIDHDAKAPTCEDIGWDAYQMCRICLANNYVELPALGHDIIQVAAKAPTCTDKGWFDYEYCSRCDINTCEERDVVPHNYVDGICVDCHESYISPNGFHAHKNKVSDPVASTCSKAGHSESIICTACGKTLVAEKPLAILPHSFENGVCTECGTVMQASAGLAFEAFGTTSYVVSGIGECTDTQVVIPSVYNGKPVTAISSNAFKDNNDIVQVVIPASVTNIGSAAFKNCQSLVSVVLNEGLEVIGNSAFMYCISLKTIDIPDSVTNLGSAAFIACYDLEEATVGSGLTKIPNDVFFECYSMETLNINSSLTSIGGWVVYDCDSLTAINYSGTADEWNSIAFGKYWDEYSGIYTVYCQGGEAVHKHVFDDWSETDVSCQITRRCTIDGCAHSETTYNHVVSNDSWVVTSSYVSQICRTCGNEANRMVVNETLLALDFEKSISEELKSYPYFRFVADTNNKYETVDGRSVWAVNKTTFIDYDKSTFENNDYYVVSFDMNVTEKPAYNGSNTAAVRDVSVFSFIPGNNGGNKVGTSVSYLWQIKYVPLLDKLSTIQLNGTDAKYFYAEDVPENVLATFNENTSASLNTNEWATVTIVCNFSTRESDVFVNGNHIGKLTLPNHENTSFSDAFSIRFVDNANFKMKFDNFKIQALVTE